MPRKNFITFAGNNSNLTIPQARARYAPVLTSREQKKLTEGDIEDLKFVEDRLTALKSNENLRRKTLIKYWFECLQLNTDYVEYCKAKKVSARKTLDTLNKKYPADSNSMGVARLYKDWGDINAVGFEAWFQKREHLFLHPEKSIDETSSKQSKFGSLMVSVPKGIEDKMELWTLFQSFYKNHYKNYRSYKPEYELSCKPTMEKLSMINMAILVHNLRKYEYAEDEDACVEADKYKDMPVEEAEFMRSNYSQSQVVQTLMDIPALRYEFGLDKTWMVNIPSDFKLLRARKLASKEIVKNKIPYINTLGKYLENCIKVSITGVFPA
jgi:hypothetical protein